jgi:hypothetical protein
MIDRRRFLKLFAGGLAAAAHGGVPSLLLKPAVSAVQALDPDRDFTISFYGLLVNARQRAFSSSGFAAWEQAERLVGEDPISGTRPVWPPLDRGSG